jgi:hypothetical protein
MTIDSQLGSPIRERQWFIVSRWQEYEGDAFVDN